MNDPYANAAPMGLTAGIGMPPQASVNERLANMRDLADVIIGNLRDLHDRIEGPRPPEGPMPVEVASGLIEQAANLNDKLCRIRDIVQQINNRI